MVPLSTNYSKSAVSYLIYTADRPHALQELPSKYYARLSIVAHAYIVLATWEAKIRRILFESSLYKTPISTND
jgi:hypothetical protein